MQQTWTAVITAVTTAVTTSVVLAFLAFIIQKWIGTRIEQSVKHSYDVHLERFREDIAVKHRAALVAELLSEWLSHPSDPTRLNRLTFEAFLWLPQDIAEDLSKRLANQPGAPDVRTLIGQVRKHLLGKSDLFDAQKVNIF